MRVHVYVCVCVCVCTRVPGVEKNDILFYPVKLLTNWFFLHRKYFFYNFKFQMY